MSSELARGLQALRIRHLAPLQRELAALWSWWVTQLLELLPPELRQRIEQRNCRLFVEEAPGAIKLRVGASLDSGALRRVGLDTSADRAIPDDLRVAETVALLPAGKVLRTSLQLPIAAEENLHEVLAFEMDRHTPFTAEQLYYDFVVKARDAGRRRLTVELVYSTRAVVEQFLEMLQGLGIRPDVITSRDAASRAALPVNLLPGDRRRTGSGSMRRLNTALAGLAAVLLIVAIALPPIQKAGLANALAPQVQAAAAEARQASQLRDEVAKLAEGGRVLASRKQSNLLVVELIDEVSRRLPDHTWLSRLDIAGNTLQLQGQSRAAAELIGIIEASPRLENVRFSSPVSQVSAAGVDQFHLTAEILWEKPQ